MASNQSDNLAPTEKEMKRSFSARLHKLREGRRYTQSQVAKALGFTSESVYQVWEKPDGNLPSAVNLRKLAIYFGVSTDYLLGVAEGAEQDPLGEPASPETPGEQGLPAAEQTQRLFFRLALEGKDSRDEEVAQLLVKQKQMRFLRWRGRDETLEECYKRIVGDAMASIPFHELPPLGRFRTAAAENVKEQVEERFRERRRENAREVTLYVFDVPARPLQDLVLSMQGAELIKERREHFTLGVSNGWMARQMLMAPTLRRGDISDVTAVPLTLGISMGDPTAATTLIGGFTLAHEGYGVRTPDQRDRYWSRRLATHLQTIDLAFMGIGAVDEPSYQQSFFADLLLSKGINTAQLKDEGVIGNVLYHLIREDPAAPSWEEYSPPARPIVVDINEQVGDEELRVLSLEMLRELVGRQHTQIVIPVKDTSRARIVRAALEMRCANAVICTLPVAEALLHLLDTYPLP
jgi:transcriptional regulator with XRE-family HTH domain